MASVKSVKVLLLLHQIALVAILLLPVPAKSFTMRIDNGTSPLTHLSTLLLSSKLTSDDGNTPNDDDLVNSAFVFIKPHANNPKVQDLVRETLLAKSLKIKSEGDISGTTIDDKKLIDQHYYAIASKATLLDPKDMAVPADKFEAFYGEKWEDVLANGKVANALQACERLGVDANGLEKAWVSV